MTFLKTDDICLNFLFGLLCELSEQKPLLCPILWVRKERNNCLHSENLLLFTTKYSPMKWQCLTFPSSFLFKYMWRDYSFSIFMQNRIQDSPSSSWQERYRIIQTLENKFSINILCRDTSLTTSVWKKIPLISLILLPLMSLNHPLKEKATEVVGKSKVSIGSHEWKKKVLQKWKLIMLLGSWHFIN